MSIASEITRLSNAKDAIKTALEGKGVTVPSETKIDEYAELIGDIETGGGLPTGISGVDYGTVTPSSNTTGNFTITHGLGAIPKGGILWTDDQSTTANTDATFTLFSMTIRAPHYKSTGGAQAGYWCARKPGGVGNNGNLAQSSVDSYFTSSALTFAHGTDGNLKAGYQYKWIVWY